MYQLRIKYYKDSTIKMHVLFDANTIPYQNIP